MKTLRTWLMAAMAVVVAGCGSSGQTGTVSVLLKDAPANFTKVVVTISEVDLVGSGGVQPLSTTERTIDLLTLANDATTLVEGVKVPAGSYSQLRFVITGGYIEADGVIYASSPAYQGLPEGAIVGGELRMPSFAQSGLKVNLPGGSVTVGTESQVLLVDFLVNESFGHETGSGAWVMHPVARCTHFELSGSLDVSLTLAPGVVLPAGQTLANFTAVLTPLPSGDPVPAPLTLTSSGASATFKYQFPGSYTLSFTAPTGVSAFTTNPTVPATVDVTSGQATSAAFVVTSTTLSP